MNFLQVFWQILFFVGVGGVVYAYLIYPILIWVLAKLFGKHPTAQPQESHLPRAALLIAAHNEASVIEERIINALETDYPSDRFEIVIASDGSIDKTVEIARAFKDPRVRVLDYPVRRGKASVLNSAIADIDAEIMLLSDANTQIDPGAAKKLVRWFTDPRIGIVCGRLVLMDAKDGANADGAYWKFETFLKKCESRLGALLGSNGAIYAIRKQVYEPIPAGTIVDDFVIPLLAKVHHRCNILYDADAVATEETAPDVSSEFGRRARIGAGGFQSIGLLWRLLHPRHGWVAFAFLSHKLIRWFCPFFLLAALIGSAMMSSRRIYLAALCTQVLLYLMALIGAYLPWRHPLLKPLRLTTMFVAMNAALLVGFWRWIRGRQKATWRRTSRSADASAPTSLGQLPQ